MSDSVIHSHFFTLKQQQVPLYRRKVRVAGANYGLRIEIFKSLTGTKLISNLIQLQ